MTEEPNTKRILLVCTGNICRSPLAAALLERALVERGIEGIAVASAGTGAWDGAPVSEGAYLVGLERGLDLSGHRARLLTRELVQAADLILTMARHHRARVDRSEEHTSELQSRFDLVCRLLLEKKNQVRKTDRDTGKD